jgi:hypothetical protein
MGLMLSCALVQFSVLGCQFSVFDYEWRWLIADRRPVSSRLRPISRFIFVERARVNVRAKGRAVNSVFLVQLRKIVATDFRGLARIQNLLEEMVLSRAVGLGSVHGGTLREMLESEKKGIVHRGCTGNAESSGQGSVIGGDLRLALLGGTAEAAVPT